MSPTFYHQSLVVISHFIYLALVYSFFVTLPPTSFTATTNTVALAMYVAIPRVETRRNQARAAPVS